jgi:hypothetical protein
MLGIYLEAGTKGLLAVACAEIVLTVFVKKQKVSELTGQDAP